MWYPNIPTVTERGEKTLKKPVSPKKTVLKDEKIEDGYRKIAFYFTHECIHIFLYFLQYFFLVIRNLHKDVVAF